MDRFWSKVDVCGPDDCWEWTAGKSKGGYGRFRLGSKKEPAHRVAMLLEHGAIPAGAWVLHTCDNPPCCNPRHLYFGTPKQNSQDREERGHGFKPREKCKYGHLFDEENTYVTYPPSFDGRPFRQCRTCMRRRQREYKARKKVAA